MAKAWDSSGIAYSVDLWKEVLRTVKPGGHLLAFGGTRTYHRMACAIEDAGFEVRDCISWNYSSGFPKSMNLEKSLEKTHHDAAQAWHGWGTALKPAHEPILLARRPVEGTLTANVLAHGAGGINVEATRVPHADAEDLAKHQKMVAAIKARGGTMGNSWANKSDLSGANDVSDAGRWPPNFLLTHAEDCSADTCVHGCPVREMEAQTAGTSRYYPTFRICQKSNKKERDAGLDDWPVVAGHDVCEREEGSAGANNPRAGVRTPRRNTHPTVKPLDLMRWLVRLVAPPGGLVLDPFAGSGTTGCAAVREGKQFVGFELDPAHAAIARARIAHWQLPTPK
jgi:site-specific DNA-methyltransferase (adenine-specific)